MVESKRIRVVFKDDDILSETQKTGGLSRSWVLLKPHQHDTISDVASHLLHVFQLHQSCPHGLLLSISSFVLPPFESSSILKDDEIIRVQKRKDILAIAGNNAANDVERLKAVGKQPVNSGLLLLASEEFGNEKGGYESGEPGEVPEEDDEEGLLEDIENPSGSNADKKKRKRKAADKLQGSKGKKHRFDATGSASNAVLTDKGKKDDSIAGDCVENNGEPPKLIDKKNVSGPSLKGTAEVQENRKETDDEKIAPKETKKVPSRSARRKYAKRRWLREMAKIQKQNATCESEGLRNWKEDQAKAGRKKVESEGKGQKKWKKHQADADGVADGQPKGLLHWIPQDNWLVKGKKRKQRSENDNFSKLRNRNDDAHEHRIQTGVGHELSTENGEGHQQPNQKQSHEQPSKENPVIQECENQTCNASEKLNEESGEENEVVPIVIRPGHIRFEPLGEEQAVQKDHVPQETFQWNGITSKKKGQQWGKESRPFTPRNDYKNSNKEYNASLNNEKEKLADEGNKEKQADCRTDFEKLSPLLGMPEKGDLIAYRILELSSSWTPELSPYRVGKVSWYNAKSNHTMLVPVPEYPIISDKADEDEAAQLDSSLYKEDGSLEIDFPALIDVRILNIGRSEPGNETTSCVSEGSVGDVNASKTILPSSSNKPTVPPSQDAMESNQGKETQPPTTENVGGDIWDQLSETLNAKKEELSKENGWGSTPKKVHLPQENSWGSTPKKVQHSQEKSWGKKPSTESNWGKKAQGPHDNSWGKQSSGSKSWSYKALRGSALGPTMAMLRSKKDM